MALGWRGSYLRYREYFLNISNLYKQRADLRAFLEIILSISTIIIFIVFALKPTAVTIIDLLQQIREKQSTLAALTQKVNNLKTASGILSQNQSVLPDINISVPNLPNPDILSGQIEGLANKNSTQVLGISISQTPIIGGLVQKKSTEFKPLPDNAKEMSFSISVKGNYSSLLSFINDFENLKITKKIDSLGLTSSVTEKGFTLVAVMSGRVPFLGK